VTLLFVLLGVGSGSLASRVPAIKGQLHLSAGALGIALLGTAVGSVLSTPISGLVLARIAPRRWVAVGLVPFTVVLPLATIATGTWSLLLVLLGVGFGMGCIDVAMNTEATRVQTRYGRRILSTFHATFSFGALAGAGVGALAAAASISFGHQFVGVGAVVLVGGVAALTLLPATPAGGDPTDAGDGDGVAAGPVGAGRPGRTGRAGRRPQWPIIALAIVSFGALLAEGATNDWSAVYLHTSLGTSAATAALGYAAFSATMVVGRLSGDHLTTRWGAVRVVRIAALLGAAGLGTALIVGHPVAAIIGFALLGCGLAVAFPLAVGAAAGHGFGPNRGAGPAVAFVTSAGYLGFLCGPPVIGGLATVASLPVALSLPVVLCAMLAVLAGSLRGGDPAAAPVEVLAD
jgi:MFS family permease